MAAYENWQLNISALYQINYLWNKSFLEVELARNFIRWALYQIFIQVNQQPWLFAITTTVAIFLSRGKRWVSFEARDALCARFQRFFIPRTLWMNQQKVNGNWTENATYWEALTLTRKPTKTVSVSVRSSAWDLFALLLIDIFEKFTSPSLTSSGFKAKRLFLFNLIEVFAILQLNRFFLFSVFLFFPFFPFFFRLNVLYKH